MTNPCQQWQGFVFVLGPTIGTVAADRVCVALSSLTGIVAADRVCDPKTGRPRNITQVIASKLDTCVPKLGTYCAQLMHSMTGNLIQNE